MRRSFGAAFTRLLRRLVAGPRLTNRYRPELHYMRGPGPKSRAQMRPQIVADGKVSCASRGNGAMP